MNNCSFIGRLANDPELKTVQTKNGDTSMVSFALAVQRPYNKNLENQEVDWPRFTAWGARADFIAKHFAKGNRVGVEASYRERMVENVESGTKTKYVDFAVNNIHFIDSKNTGTSTSNTDTTPRENYNSNNPNTTIESAEDDDYPF